MLTVIQEVGTPCVVNRDPGELRQDPNGFHGRLTSARIDVIVGEGGCASEVHPVPKALHREARFFLMDHLALDQGRGDLLLHGSQLSRTAFDQLPGRPFTHVDAQQVPHHLTGPGPRAAIAVRPDTPPSLPPAAHIGRGPVPWKERRRW